MPSTVLQVSERRACRAIGQLRSSSRYVPRPDPFRERVCERILALAKEDGRYGYRTVTDRLRLEGWDVGKDRVYTIWRHEGLQVPTKQPKRARLWRADGSCLRLRPAYRHHVWSYDVVADLFLRRGIPTHIRSDNGPEFIARKLRQWLTARQVAPLYIEPGSPWENGYCESLNGKMRDQLLNGELFYTLKEAQSIIERWRIHYNTVRPHSSLGGQPPAPEAIQLAS